MADRLPVKAKYATGSPVDVIALQEFEPSDTIGLNLISGFPAGVTAELANNSISTLSDVDTTGSPLPTNGDVLAWNSSSNAWEPTLSPGSSAAVWGNITGILSNQTDLQTALDLKADQTSLDTHTGDATIHFTEASIDHLNVLNVGTNSHAQIDTHITDSTIHYTQASISINESQISDLQSYALSTHTHAVNDLTDVANIIPTDKHVLIYEGITNNRYENRLLVEADISDFGTYESAFSKNTGFNLNLGTSAGTVSEGNHNHDTVYASIVHTHVMVDVTDSTWISDITNESINDLSNVLTSMTPTDGQVLTYDITNGWQAETTATVITDHTLLTNIGVNTHAQIDTHFADGTIHFTEASIDHVNILNIGTNTHAQIDTHITDATIHFTQASISITESQINDLQSYALSTHTHALNELTDVLNVTPADKHLLIYDGVTDNRYENRLLVEADISDFGTYEPAFSKNTGFNKTFGTSAGTVAEGNHTHVMVDITDSTWISNITGESITSLSDVNSLMTPTDGQVLTYNGTSSEWEATPASGGSSVDRQIVSSATTTSTTSGSYIDLSLMTLTTNNLGETGTYKIDFNARVANSATGGGGFEGADVNYILVVNGVQQTNSKATMVSKESNTYTVSISWLVSGVSAGTIIKVQWFRESSTGYTYERRLIIDGVPDSSVI